MTFYTDGLHTLLGPSGWTCALVDSRRVVVSDVGLQHHHEHRLRDARPRPPRPRPPTSGQTAAIGAQGATTLALYPPNDPNPPTSGAPAPGAEGIFATYATTGSDAGVFLVCPFFTIPSWQSQSTGCTTTKPTGELTNALTPDVTAIADPAGVVGNLAASGGQTTVTGVVLFPQIPSAVSYGSPIAVAAESCSLDDAEPLRHGRCRTSRSASSPSRPSATAASRRVCRASAGGTPPPRPGVVRTRTATDLHPPPRTAATARDNSAADPAAPCWTSPPSVELLDPSVSRS